MLDKQEPDFPGFMDILNGNIFSRDEYKLKTIITDLAAYDIYDVIARISCLNLMIENQNKSILLDALIAGILARPREYYQGKVRMSGGKFRSIINRLESMRLKLMVDPAENAFVERVRYYGNYWIFPGINYSPANTLQGFLNVLCLRDLPFDDNFTHKSHQLINFVLRISDIAAQRLGYDLNAIRHVEQSGIKLPDSKLFDELKNCVYLQNSVIEDLIDDEDIYQLLFTDFYERDLSQIITGQFQDFVAHPFLKVNDDTVLLLNPSMLVPFAVHHIILLADRFGCKEFLINSYNDEIWEGCKKDLRELGHKKIQESVYGIELIDNQSRKEEIMTVGNDKLLFVHFICDAGTDYDSKSIFKKHKLETDMNSVHDRDEYFINRISITEKNNVFQIVILNSFGRMVECEMTTEEDDYSIFLSPQELHCISVNEQDRLEFIPRYIAAKRELVMMVLPMGLSELNSIEIYTSNDYSFYLSDDYDPKGIATLFAPGDSLDYVIRAIKKEDRHLISSYDGVHLCDVILSDPVRHIYFSKSQGVTLPTLVVKFDHVNVWFTEGPITSAEKANVLWVIIDTISYWLAEAKEIIKKMHFRTDAIRIHVDLSGSVEKYYNKNEEHSDFLSGIEYMYSENTLNMIWKPIAYRHLGEETNNTEKVLLKSMLEEIAKLNQTEVDLSTLEILFSNPLKKKVYEINRNDAPYMIPIPGEAPIIFEAEENRLLDEIGTHFLKLPEYCYGRVSDEKRVELMNDVVGYLYCLLQTEIATINSTGVYEKVCFDLESVLSKAMIAQRRYAYDIACYPEKAEEIFERYNEINKVSVALRFFAEYIAAVPPSGKKALGSMQYDRILAICSLIIDWAYKNDLVVYDICNPKIEFLKSGRIGISRTESTYLAQVNGVASRGRLESLSDPGISVYTPLEPLSEFNELIDDAFFDEYGFTFRQFSSCIIAIADYGETIKSEVKRENKNILINNIAQMCQMSIECVNSVIDLISLSRRDDFLDPPKPFKRYDVYPWRFNRELSFARRPIIQNNDDLIWGNRQLQHMIRYVVDLIISGRYKARRQKLKRLIGKLSNIRGNEFNSVVYQKLNCIDGLIVVEKLSKVNGKKITEENGEVLGDIDVLYIIPDKRKIVVGEVKDFSFAKNPYEMNQEYKRIFVDGDRPCYMTKHKRRAIWIKEHLDDVKIHFGLADGKWSIKTVMFVSNKVVSNDFYHRKEKIITYSEITERNVKSV